MKSCTKVIVAIALAVMVGEVIAAEMIVSGTGNVGIREMRGGTIQIGLTEEQARLLINSKGKEQEQALRELAALESDRQAAGVLASRGSLALTQLEWERGAVLLQRAFAQRADDVDQKTFWWLLEAGDAWATIGKSDKAMQAYQQAGNKGMTKLAADPANVEWQRDLSVSHDRIGDTFKAQGNLAGALTSYQAGMTIAQKLATSDPANVEWQRDLSVSHNKIDNTRAPPMPCSRIEPLRPLETKCPNTRFIPRGALSI